MALALLEAEQLPALAVDALLQGFDSPALRELAGLSACDMDEAVVLFRRVLRELGRAELTKEAALRELSDRVLKQIVDSEIEPYAGARWLWRAALESQADHGHELDPFIYAASEYEDRPQDREFFLKAIIAEARELLERRQEAAAGSERQ